MTFRIYYCDGSKFDDIATDAPKTGVCCILQADDACGRLILHGEPFYCWHEAEQQWFPHDSVGFWLCQSKPGSRYVVFGESVTNVRYREIYREANLDPDFKLIARDPFERRSPE